MLTQAHSPWTDIDTALRPHRVPSDPTTSPPPPPPTFNPPANTTHDPAHSISPPTSNESSPMTSSFSVHDILSSPNATSSPAASSVPRRPDLRAVQRVSDDVILSSVGTGSQGSVTSSPTGSEGGEHLQEMRSRLLSESSIATTSRRDSDSSDAKSSSRRDSDPVSQDPRIDIHVTVPTPPSTTDDQTALPEAGPSRIMSPSTTSSPQLQQLDTSTEHKWDSVVSHFELLQV